VRIGIMADIHDKVDNLRHAIALFNSERCDLVLLAGDFVSPLVVPSMRKLTCPVVACFGDNDGNQIGIAGGMKIVGTLAHSPMCHQAKDGTRIAMAHQLNDLRDCLGEADIIVFAHTHRPSVVKDRHERLFVNPGEVGGWMFRRPSVAIVETASKEARIVNLPTMPEPVHIPEPG
jgi:putative phosphoesterase